MKRESATIQVTDFYLWLKIMSRIKWASNLHVLSNSKEYTGPRWIFRGQANAGWSIESSFERKVLSQYAEKSKELEYTLRTKERLSIECYRQHARGFVVPEASNGDVLALMRHNGVPTRLVDFTEVPLVALFFALEDEKEKGDFAVGASVADTSQNSYVIGAKKKVNPEVLMRAKGFCAYRKPQIELDYDMKSLLIWDESDRSQFEELLCDTRKEIEAPILKYTPSVLNNRQRAQRGLFLSCTKLTSKFMPAYLAWIGVDSKSISEGQNKDRDLLQANGFISEEFEEVKLLKFVFPAALRRVAKEFLDICNLNKQSLYDDLQGVSEYVTSILESKVHCVNADRNV